MEERLKWVDSSRGLAMLLVILSHCLTIVTITLPYLNSFILAFHMPLFFFISGMFAKPIKGSWGGHLYKQVKRILLPQLVLCVLRIIENLLVAVMTARSVSDIQWINWDWFLPVLFICSVTYSSLVTIHKGKIIYMKFILLLVSFAMIYPGQVLNQHEFTYIGTIINSRHIAVLPMAFFFYMMGSLYMEYKEQIKLFTNRICSSELKGLLFIILLFVLFALSSINGPAHMYENKYGNIILFLITSFMGIKVGLTIAKNLSGSQFLEYVGMNSIIFYVWNFIVVHVFTSLLFRLFEGIINNEAIVLLSFVIVLFALYAIVKLSNRFFPFIYGK